MTRSEAINYLTSTGLTEEQVMEVVEALRQEPCEDAVSRQAVEKITWEEPSYTDALNVLTEVREKIRQLPPVNPQYTEDEIQKMQNLEQAEIEKAYELGKAEQQTCEDAVSREAVLDVIDDIDKTTCMNEYHVIVDAIDKLPSVNPQPKMSSSENPNKLKTGQFAKWVATEIFDDMWEYNKDAFAELACRKLAKLGIVRAKGDKWELIEPQESEDKE